MKKIALSSMIVIAGSFNCVAAEKDTRKTDALQKKTEVIRALKDLPVEFNGTIAFTQASLIGNGDNFLICHKNGNEVDCE